MAVSESLRKQVKTKLRITWDDPDTDAQIDEIIIPSAEAAIRSKVGIPESAELEFGANGAEAETLLLLAHCYYQWNDAEDEFDGNYRHEIGQARAKWEVWQDAQGQEAPSDV